jgi:hypothetical protein
MNSAVELGQRNRRSVQMATRRGHRPRNVELASESESPTAASAKERVHHSNGRVQTRSLFYSMAIPQRSTPLVRKKKCIHSIEVLSEQDQWSDGII